MTFVKRKGTTDLGKDYEDMVVTNLVVRLLTSESIDNFKLSSNHEKFDNFDDIVLEVLSNQKQEKYAVQLKHKGKNNKSLTIESLKAEKGNFAIKKYFESFQKIKDRMPCKLLIFTNYVGDALDNRRLQLDGEDFEIQITKFVPQFLFDISEKTGHCYRFHITKSSKQMVEYKEFFENFFLYTNQHNFEKFRTITVNILKDLFSCGDTNIDKFFKLISEWSKREGNKEMLDKIWMNQALTLCMLESDIKPLFFGHVNENMKILRRAIFEFNVSLFGPRSYDQIKRLWGDATGDFGDVKELNRLRIKYHLASDHFDTVELDDLLSSKLLWLLNKCPLIVRQNETTQKVIQFCSTGKFVVLGENLIFKEMFQKLSDLALESESYKDITTKFKFSLQGKTVNLDAVIDQELVIKTDDLLKMSYGSCNIGGGKELLPEPYVSRVLLQNDIDLKYLEKIDDRTMIVIICTDQLELPSQLNNCHFIDVERITPESQFGSSVYFTSEECSTDQLQFIVSKNHTIKKCHHFAFTPAKNLQWIRSVGDITDLQQYKSEECVSVQEKSLWSSTPKNFLNLIIGDAGFGKTELLKNLKNNFCEKFWTIILYPKDIHSILKHQKFDQFIVDEKCKNLENFDIDFLKISIQTKKVAFIWDALDEIPKEQLDDVIKLIVTLHERRFIQYVTSRSHLKNFLERKFNVISKNMSEFTEKEQESYIQTRLKDISVQEDTKEIIDKIKSIFTCVKHTDILGIPLLIFMLTELFRQNQEKYMNLLENFSLIDLYFYFVKEKFNHHYKEKVGLNFHSFQTKPMVEHYTKYTFENYEKAACITLLPEEMSRKNNIICEDYLQSVQESKDDFGIIVEVVDQIPRFLHTSFAEYFVARYFAGHLDTVQNLDSVLFDKRYTNVRFFFDLMLAKKSLPHLAVLYRNFELLKNYEDDLLMSEDAGGRTVLHLASLWGQNYPTLNVDKINEIFIIDDESDFFVAPEKVEYLEMLNYLLEKCDNSKRDKLFNMTAMSYAEKNQSLLVKFQILQKQSNLFPIYDDFSFCNILYYSVRFGYDFILDMLEFKEIFVKTKKNMRSLLHWSVSQQNCFLKLLRINLYKVNINDKDKFGATPLHMASEGGHDKVVRSLIEAGARIDLTTDTGATALFVSCRKGNKTIAAYLIENGADIDAPTKTNQTPLYAACQNGHDQVVRLLVETGADINFATTKGWTPLHISCQNRHKNIVNYLIKIGAGVNLPATDGWSPLHCACQNGDSEIVATLKEAGASIDHTTASGATPLYIACFNRYVRVVAYLIQAGANVNLAKKYNKRGWTPLHIASQKGSEDIVALLTKSGAVTDTHGDENWTPLHIATKNKREKVVGALIAAGATVDVGTDLGATPLYLACVHGHHNITTLLIRAGASIHFTNVDGWSPLHAACNGGHEKLVAQLVLAGASVNLGDEDGDTPLHLACYKGHDQIVAYLINAGADINFRAKNGETPLDVSRSRRHDKIVRLLMQSGADVKNKKVKYSKCRLS